MTWAFGFGEVLVFIEAFEPGKTLRFCETLGFELSEALGFRETMSFELSKALIPGQGRLDRSQRIAGFAAFDEDIFFILKDDPTVFV